MDNKIDLMSEYTKLANRLTKLYRDEIIALKLVDTGKLLNSIRWFVIKTNTGWNLKMEAMDYFYYLDERYGISKNIEKKSEYNKIFDDIANLYVLQITIEFD
jgi:hypothetical protein